MMTDFIREDLEPNQYGKKPDRRTVQKLPFVFQLGSGWWVDMDAYRLSLSMEKVSDNLLNALMDDPKVVEMVGNV